MIGRSGPLRRRTDSSAFIHTMRQSPIARAASRVRTWPACSKSKHPPAATTVPPRARTPCASRTASCSTARGAGTSALASARDVTPPPRRKAAAAATASRLASARLAPAARATIALAARRSPAPHGSVVATAATSIRCGASPSTTRSAPSAPRVTRTALLPVPARSARPAAAAGSPSSSFDSAPVASIASRRFGVASRVPGTGTGPRGCGSQTSGTPATARRSRAARMAGCAVTPRP